MSATLVFCLVLPVPVKIAGAPVEWALLASRDVPRSSFFGTVARGEA
jgi:hypothetical protein